MDKTVYNLDPVTGELLSQEPARESPMEKDTFLKPAYATFEAPPPPIEGQARVCIDDLWSYVPDPRGVWYGADQQQRFVLQLDANVDGLTRVAPPGPDYELVSGQWALSADLTVSLLAAAKVTAQAAIDAYYQTLFDLSVPNNAMKAEYDAAYMLAKHWLDNQGEPAPERIKALAESYGVSNVQAAGVVVTKWTEAQALAFDLRGAARLRAKLAIRQAVDAAGVAAAELAGRAAMEAVVYIV